MKKLLFALLLMVSSCSEQAVNVDKSIETPNTYWKGKNIVWTGTSIPWQFAPDSYPEKIGRLLGAKVYNEAISGSGIIFRRPAGNDKGRNGMSGTYEELIAAHFSQNYSYENRILAFLGAPYNADLIVLDHGHNDTKDLENNLGDIDSQDKTTLYGAFNTVIAAILEKKPTCTIVLCTPPNGYVYGGVEPLKTEFKILREAILALGKKWNLPVWDMMQRSGITAENVSMWTTDDIHPNRAMTDTLAKDGAAFFSAIKFN